MSALLALEHLTAGYGDAVILEDVSLELPQRGSLTLLGRNGAGKSTLIASVMGLTRVQAGGVTFDRADITRWRPHRSSS